MSIANERLDEVQGRLDASTWTPEEPWHVRTTWGGYGPNYVARCVDDGIVKVTGDLPSKEDSRLIGKAPQDLTDLLAEVHRLKRRVGLLQSENHKLSEALTTSGHREDK